MSEAISELERLTDLLGERLDRPLSAEEQAEVERLLAAMPEMKEDDLELAAASLLVAIYDGAAPLQASIRQRLEATIPGADVVPLKRSSKSSALGWAVAALAAGLAIFGWWPRIAPPPPMVPPTLAQKRTELMAHPTAAKLDWAAAGDPLVKTIAGDVIWDGKDQTGYMRFVGLPKNDPSVSQYQLWIFDAERDERYPVDGGVFDVGSDGEVVVPIVAKVAVGKPVLFAVTLEKPGGVVVSAREHILIVAKPG